MKNLWRKGWALLAAGIMLCGIPTSALTFTEADVHNDSRIDVCDLVAAKKLAANHPPQYMADFLSELTNYLLGKTELSQETSSNPASSTNHTGSTGSQGEIYLPEVP